MANLLQDLVTVQADHRPEAVALAIGESTTRYMDLETRSNQLARLLREHGCRRGDRIGVFQTGSDESIVAMLAVLKADAIYVPLDDVGLPGQVDVAVAASQPRCLLLPAGSARTVERLFRSGVVDPSTMTASLGRSPIGSDSFFTRFSFSDLSSAPSRPIAAHNRATNPAYLVFTTDRTGTPRGVVGTHMAVRRFVLWANDYFEVRPGTRHVWQAPCSSDSSIYGALGPLAAGATVCPLAADVESSPHRLASAIRRQRLTHAGLSPAAMKAVAEADAVLPGDFPSLRRVVWWGTPLPGQILHYWMTRLSHVQFTALYGFSEATIASAYHTFERGQGEPKLPVPVGKACPGEEVLVVDRQLGPVGVEGVGEICIRGLGLGPGYWQDSEGTRTWFPRNPGGADPADRLFRTGDLGRVGADGHIYVVGQTAERTEV